MLFFIDAEFCVPSDTLISLGIVSEDGNKTFYEVIDYVGKIQDPWVLQNVVPILQKDPVSFDVFQAKLEEFVSQFAGMEIIANHPSDILYFNKALIKDKGKWIKIQPLTFVVDDNLSGKGSTLLHNAIHDAQATRKDWLKHYG